jgi:hypothetical protein
MVKELVKLYLHSPNTPSWRGDQLKHRDNFTFTINPETHGRTALMGDSKIKVKLSICLTKYETMKTGSLLNYAARHEDV